MAERVIDFEAERNRRAGSRTAARGAGKRLPRRLLLLGLLLLGAVAALFSTSRRAQFDRRWEDWRDDAEPFEPPAQGEPPVPSVVREVRGPAGLLHVDDGGQGGLPVVFVHGLGGSARQWREQLAVQRRERRALAFDLRGHGLSERSKGGGYGISDFASDLAAVADDLDLDRFLLVGHSLGGTVASFYAGRHPERVAGLLLADPNGDMTRIPREEMAPLLAALEQDPRAEMRWHFKQVLVGAEPAVADEVLADLERADPEAFRTALESGSRYSPIQALERYTGPKLSVVSHMNDLPYSLHNLTELPHRMLVGTSHWLMLDRPEVFNQMLTELAGQARASS